MTSLYTPRNRCQCVSADEQSHLVADCGCGLFISLIVYFFDVDSLAVREVLSILDCLGLIDFALSSGAPFIWSLS